MKYYLALNYGCEGWGLTEFDTKEELLLSIKDGNTFGNKFKIFKEIELKLIED